MPCPSGPCTNEFDVMPSRLAISAVSFTPTSRMSWANTVLTDFCVACRSVMLPPPSPSAALWIRQFAFLHPGGENTFGAEYTLSGEYPLDSAVASVNGLNDEPACRPMLPPESVVPPKHVGSTRYLSAGLVSRCGHPPSAKLSWAYLPLPKLRPLMTALT